MARPTLGSTTAKEQNGTERNSRELEYGLGSHGHASRARGVAGGRDRVAAAVGRLILVLAGDAGVYRLVHGDVRQLVERLVDEDDADEAREALLGEARDVAHHEAELERHDHLQRHHHPEPDPEPERNERQVVVPATTCTASRAIHRATVA